MRVLITLMGSLGDVARGLTLLPRIKNHAPKSRVTWLVEPKSESLVRLSPHVDRVVVFSRGRGVHALFDVRRELRLETYDVALDLQRHFKSGFLTALSGAPRRIGFHRANAKEFNFIFSSETIPAYEEEEANKGEVYHRFLDHLGVPRAEHNFLSELRTQVDARIDSAAYLVFVLGSSWESKDWLVSGYHELGTRVLRETGLSIVLVGDASQQTMSKDLERSLGSPRVFNRTGATTIAELVSVLSHARAAVGPDSGPGHIAAGLAVPYVALFGPTAPERTAPLGKQVGVVRSAVGCSPCYRRMCPGLGKVCMKLISPSQVFSALAPYVLENVRTSP